MRVVLVQGRYFNSWEALGLGYIGAYVARYEPRAILSFFQGCFDSDDEIVRGCAGADIIGFSATSPSVKNCLDLAKRIKQENPRAYTVMGGYHASALPVQTLQDRCIDEVVVGEGEKAMLGIVQGDRRLIAYGARAVPFDMPWPDRKLIRNERNVDVAQKETGKRITSFQAHRGCPFRCVYCADGNGCLYAGVVAARDTGDLLDEMELVTAGYSLDLLKFCDATWNVSIPWVKRFCSEKISRGFTTPFFVNLHANLVDESMVGLMSNAGCCEVGMGVESGSQRILDTIGKQTTRESVLKARLLCKQAGIRVRGYFILGMPDEAEEDLKLTEEFAEQLDLDEYGFSILCPYPGTALYESSEHTLEKRDWSSTDEYSNDFWRTRHLDNAALKEWQAKLVTKFKDKITWHNQTILKT